MGTMTNTRADEVLNAIASGDAPVLEQALAMQIDSFDRSGLSEREYMLTRIAALVATDADAASYGMHFRAAQQMGIDRDTVASVLVSTAPVVGTAKITSAVSHMAKAKILGDKIQQRLDEMGY